MIDVLLAHAFYLDNDTKQREEKFKPYPPLATLYTASLLRESGYKIGLFDATLKKDGDEFDEALTRLSPKLLIVYEDSFNFLSKMCLLHVREATCRMMASASKAGIPVIISSSDASDDPEYYISNGASIVMTGEAENTARELTGILLNRSCKTLDDVAGIVFKRTNGSENLIRTLRRQNEKLPDNIPFPARDLLDIDSYRSAWKKHHDKFSLNMVTTRGCPYSCTWCAKPIWGKSYAVRSPESVADEMAQVKQLYNPDHIWFADDIFALKPGWVDRFAIAISNRDAVIPFMIQTRADLMTDSVVDGLAKAGCTEVWLGAESGSQKVLDAMKKGITIEQIHSARSLLAKRGIRACFFIQFGYPGETFDDIVETFELVKTCLPDDIGVSVSYPLPGTEFHDLVNDEIANKRHWRESNDLEMMFRGTFDTQFYRKLGKFLHKELNTRLNQSGSTYNKDIFALSNEWDELMVLSKQHYNEHPTDIDNAVPLQFYT